MLIVEASDSIKGGERLVVDNRILFSLDSILGLTSNSLPKTTRQNFNYLEVTPPLVQESLEMSSL